MMKVQNGGNDARDDHAHENDDDDDDDNER